jgi:hypothetical protein
VRNIFLLEIPVRDLMMMKMIRLVRSGVPWRHSLGHSLGELWMI